MKKNPICILALALCTALGVLRTLDLLLYTDAVTGFFTQGSVWTRYLCALPVLVLAVGAGLRVPAFTRLHRQSMRSALPLPLGRFARILFAALGFCSAVYGFLQFFTVALNGVQVGSERHPLSPVLQQLALAFHLIGAVLFVVFGAWCVFTALGFSGGKPLPTGIGIAGSVAFFILAACRFFAQPTSLHRFIPISNICSSLAALLFSVALLRIFYTPAQEGVARKVCRWGIVAFFLCCCVGAPQTLWQIMHGGLPLTESVLGIVLALLGLLGGMCALATTQTEPADTPPSSSKPKKARKQQTL